MTLCEWIVVSLIAVLGHTMAFVWYFAKKHDWKICERLIYDLPIKETQVKRELKNSIHTPIHAFLLAILLSIGYFEGTSLIAFTVTLMATIVWAEIWHYFSHRAFHLRSLHWIHAEHHKSRLNTPFTAISFSFSEKLIFDIGLLLPFVIFDYFFTVNFFGIATWYVFYLVINSFSHANFEFRTVKYNQHIGKVLTTTTYHSLHHSRYTGNYGLGTRILDKVLGTEWEDYERLYDRVCSERHPLANLRERVE